MTSRTILKTGLLAGLALCLQIAVAGARRWIDKMKELNMTHQYVETAGGTHGSVMTTGMPDIFAFFAKYSK